MVPRGGTTEGTPVEVAESPGDRWKALQEDGLTSFEKDRRAILAMTGSYRVSFQFVETMGFSESYDPPRPYFSWATEHIHVLEDRGEFIRLQHTLVMYFEKEDGGRKGPMVMKHWRQDWRYEDQTRLTYRGKKRWERTTMDPDAVRGTWTQTVYQVDDAPRYEAVGRWEHDRQFSTWTSERFNRPLPRREFSAREDYDLLEGRNIITITPRGWVHEQNNRKRPLRGPEEENQGPAYLAKEYGINRYVRIRKPDLDGPATSYWKRTGAFWDIVRNEWTRVLDEHDRFRLRSTVDGTKLHKHLFGYASKIKADDSFDAEKATSFVRKKLSAYVEPVPSDTEK